MRGGSWRPLESGQQPPGRLVPTYPGLAPLGRKVLQTPAPAARARSPSPDEKEKAQPAKCLRGHRCVRQNLPRNPTTLLLSTCSANLRPRAQRLKLRSSEYSQSGPQGVEDPRDTCLNLAFSLLVVLGVKARRRGFQIRTRDDHWVRLRTGRQEPGPRWPQGGRRGRRRWLGGTHGLCPGG